MIATNKACGYYSMNNRIANAVMVHNIVFKVKNGIRIFETSEFSSINFTNLYMKNALSRNIPTNYFDDYKKIIKLDGAIKKIVDYIHVNNGFIVIGWYKRGEFEDRGNEDREQVDASNMMIHSVSIYQYLQTITSTQLIKNNIFDFKSEI